MIERKQYLERLINSRHNGLIKVITGIRRCGKSYLLDPIFKTYLKSQGVDDNHIIKIDLDERRYKDLLNADNLDIFVRNKITDEGQYYLLLDEVQYVQDFESVLNGFLHIKNLDVYVTGSNSKFLSKDIATSLRGRGEQIRIFPLSFREYYEYTGGDRQNIFEDYITFGGMPFVLSKQSKMEKSIYLKELFELTYIRDIVERNRIQKK